MSLEMVSRVRRYQEQCRALQPLGYQGNRLGSYRKDPLYTAVTFDSPSGPAAQRARLHETLAKFDLSIVYVPGQDSIVVDCLSC